MNGYLLTLAFFCLVSLSHAQMNLHGRVINSDNMPLAYANVMLVDSGEQTLVKTVLTNESGDFMLESIPSGRYKLNVSSLGYKTYSSSTITASGNDIKIPDIVLEGSAKSLNEVTVTAQRPFVEVKQDRLVVNVENSIVSAGSTALEVLARSPGVLVDQNDNISLKGKQGVTVMMDDKLLHVSGEQLANMLKNMPSGNIAQIEIITNPSAKYDAAGNAGIINIKTKRDKRVGWNGSITASAGHGFYPKANAGVSLNYRGKRFTSFANYNRGHRQGFNELTLIRRFYTGVALESPFSSYDQLHDAEMRFNNHSAGAGFDYNITPKTTIGLAGNAMFNYHKSYSQVTSIEKDTNGVAVAEFNTDNKSRSNWNNVSANLNMRHTFDSLGQTLSWDADFAQFWNSNNQNLQTSYFNAEGIPTLPAYVLKGEIAGKTEIRSFKADYTLPFRFGLKLDAGVKTSFVTADNKPTFYNASDSENITYDSTKSNHYVYDENINAAYANASMDIGKWSFQLGLRGEQTNVHAVQKVTDQTKDTSYTKLFPSIAVQHHFNETHDLGLTLSRRIDRPTYWQLNPFRFYMDPSTFNEGNPNLGPQLTYATEVSHTFKQRFVTTLSASYTTDVIAEVLVPYPGKITVQTNRNIAEMYYYGLSVAYPFQITKWWSNVTNLNAYYQQYKGNLANTTIDEGKPTFDLNTPNAFTLTPTSSAELSLFYQAPQLHGFMHLNEIWMLNIGVQKSFFNKKLSAKLNLTDVFWKGYPSATSYYSDYNEDFVAKRDTRVLTLSLTYRFGKAPGGPLRRRAGGAEEEIRRAGQQ